MVSQAESRHHRVALGAKATDDGSRQGMMMRRLRGCCASLVVGFTLVVIVGA
jgi:hypothetical protein